MKDPRHYQIAVLSFLLAYGLFVLRFDLSFLQVAVTLLTVLLTQLLATKIADLGRFEPRSALISGLSLCLLLRTNHVAVVVAAAVVAIASKFTLRVRGKHVFNPTNLALLLVLLSGLGWVSPGQWGQTVIFGFLVACAGGLVVYRAMRSDVTYAFLATYLALMVGREVWLGDPMAIPIHRLENGGLILFAFFMISDPKTTPDHRLTRIAFGAAVAYVSWHIQFRMFRTNGLLWALGGFSLLVPLLDRLFPGTPYFWGSPGPKRSHRQGGKHEAPALPRPVPDLAAAR